MTQKKIKCLIIDDDPFILNLLQDKLRQHIPEIQVLSAASSGKEGIQKIQSLSPDLIFLDVEMSDMTGFEMLSKIEKIDFKIIFITSYSHYAIRAIRFNALDYLLKPIDLGELKKSIKRYKVSSLESKNLQLALQNTRTKRVSEHKLILKTQEGEIKLIVKDIVRLKGDRNYSYIYLSNGKKKLVSKTLVYLEKLLDNKGFYRCHRSHLINGEHILDTKNNIFVLLSDGSELPIARRKKAEFNIWYNEYLQGQY